MRPWRSRLDAVLGAAWYLVVVVVLPVIVLLIAGLVFLWQQGYLLNTLLFWLAVTLIGYGLFEFWPKSQSKAVHDNSPTNQLGENHSLDDNRIPDQLDTPADWTDRDREAWQLSCTAIEDALAQTTSWDELPDIGLQQLSLIAEQYHRAEPDAQWRFTLPEALLIVSVASERYRRVIMETVPFAESIQLGSVLSLYRRKQQLKGGYIWFNRARRVARLINPVSAVVGEVREYVTGRVLGQVSDTLQRSLQRLLLQEIAQASINLYSGRLKVSDAELHDYVSRESLADKHRHATPSEPLRVLILGQISAGKSSLINALVDELQAETDSLPSTDQLTVHVLNTANHDIIHLVDTPGIERNEATLDTLAEAAQHADLTVWVARATQPGRAADHALLQRIQHHFDAHPERRAPPTVLVMTYADALSPKNQWDPPYDLSSNQGKALTIRTALDSVREQIGFLKDTTAIPVCVADDRQHYNVDAVSSQILALAEDAVNTQLNRRRVERASQGPGWQARWQQVRKLGKALGRSVMGRS